MQRFCREKGADLLRVTNEEQSDFFKQLLPTLFEKPYGYWIGLTDLANPGTWVWTQIRQLPVYTDWDTPADQPAVNSTKHCAVLYKEGYMWHVKTCHNEKKVICQI